VTTTGYDPQDSHEPNPDEPPVTGNRIIDSALAALAGTQQLTVTEQLQRLGAAHETLADVLESSRSAAIPMPKPQTRQP
jgi:hypothetical protein